MVTDLRKLIVRTLRESRGIEITPSEVKDARVVKIGESDMVNIEADIVLKAPVFHVVLTAKIEKNKT